MAGVRHLRQGIGVLQRVSQTRSFLSRILAHLVPPRQLPQPSHTPPLHFHSQSIHTRFSLPVQHALSRPFSAPRLPKPPTIPRNVTHVGLGTARAFHSGRPIFQNMVDNVPIATRALWEAEWDVKMKKKAARRLRRSSKDKAVKSSHQMLRPNTTTESWHYNQSEFDVYFPVKPVSAVTTHLLVPLAPTPSARLPLSTRSDGLGSHPLLPVPDLAHIHSTHRLHSLRVSTLFARLDSANVWDDPGVNVDAYAFGPRHDAGEKQCTILRVSFKGWSAPRVRAILGDPSEEWYTLQETKLDGMPIPPSLPDSHQDAYSTVHPQSHSFESIELSSCQTSEVGPDDHDDGLSPLPARASASAQHDLVLPTLDFSSAFSDTAASFAVPPQPVMFLCTASELARDGGPASTIMASVTDVSWEPLGLSSSFLKHVEENRRGDAVEEL